MVAQAEHGYIEGALGHRAQLLMAGLLAQSWEFGEESTEPIRGEDKSRGACVLISRCSFFLSSVLFFPGLFWSWFDVWVQLDR